MKQISKKIGLIGCGNMGSAILAGLIHNRIAHSSQITVCDGIVGKMNSLARRFSVKKTKSNSELVRQAEIILLAVKPQDLNSLAGEIRSYLTSKHVVISILAGTPIQKLKRILGSKPQIVRAMPNLGAQVSESITVVTGSSKTLQLAQIIFSGCGQVISVSEKYFDLITGVSGSGPAYFFLLMELLAKAAEQNGISKQIARLLAVQTAVGAAKLAQQSKEHPETLRQQVTSKKGTTDAALRYLEKKKFGPTFLKAINQAVKRARELSRL